MELVVLNILGLVFIYFLIRGILKNIIRDAIIDAYDYINKREE